jgi:bifunctional DNase/RNase
MIRCYIQTLIISQAVSPSVLVLRPYTDSPVQNTCKVLPIWIGLTEATQMGLAIEKIRLPRPVTHDVFLDALTNLNTYVDHVLISGVKNDTFFVRLYLRHHGDLIDLDARPSDAINLAIRQNAPIYVEEEVLDQQSFPYIIKKNHAIDENDIEQFHTFIKTIKPEDFENDG